MDKFEKKARDYWTIANIAESKGFLDVAATNYFKVLASINDFVLSKKDLYAKDHNSRFNLLKEHEPFLYEMTSKLFLVYRRTYTNEITSEEINSLKLSIAEAFNYAKIKL